jgi:tRNA-binding protein
MLPSPWRRRLNDPSKEATLSEPDPARPLPTVDPSQFFGVDVRSAVITEVQDFPEARRPAYKLRLDLGPLGERVSSAQISDYAKEELLGSTVVCVVNFPPKRVAGFKSEVLVLGVYDPDGKVVLLRPDRPVPPGHRVG